VLKVRISVDNPQLLAENRISIQGSGAEITRGTSRRKHGGVNTLDTKGVENCAALVQ